jgi:gluconolactonase
MTRGPARRAPRRRASAAALAAGALLGLGAPSGAAPPAAPEGPPDAVIDLATREGVDAVGGAWRYADATVVATTHRAPDADGQPTGAPVPTFEIAPRAGGRDFDDSAWPVLDPTTLAARRGNGRLSFNWYRIALTLPARVGGLDPTGAAVVFQTTLDDYAEVWVDGELARGLGQRGGSVVAGWNAPNRVLLARRARPGQRIQLAVFGANGPLSDPPANFIWMREARLELYREGLPAPVAVPPAEVNLEVERLDPALDAIVPANPKLWKLAEGFAFTEGPLWLPAEGVLLFSDPNENRIYRYDPRGEGRLAVFRERSGYAGADLAEYGQPGSNGLALDPDGRLTVCEHGRRRVVRAGAAGAPDEALAERFEGRRLNSPNDLVWRSDGTLYFSDPPFGLPRFFDDPRKELPWSGVFAWKDGALRAVSRELAGPNGVALSPDERFLYVTNWDPARKVVLRHAVRPDGSLGPGAVLLDLTEAPGAEALDGVKVDRAGNLYVSGPGGLWVVSPEGRALGVLRGPQLAANFAFGDDDGRTLYLTARTGLYKTRLGVPGTRAAARSATP